MATRESRDLANLKKYVGKLKVYLRKQQQFQRELVNLVRRLKRNSGVGGPGVTNPPPPPFKP